MVDNSFKNKTIAKNTAFLYVRMLFVLIVSLYTSRVILNTIGVEDFGVYNVIGGFVAMFSFLNVSLSASIQRYYNFEKGKSGDFGFTSVYSTAVVLQFLLMLLLLIIVEPLGIWYINNKVVVPPESLFASKVIFQFSLASLCLVVLQVPYLAAILAKERMNYYAYVGIVDVFLKLLIVLLLPILPYNKLITYGILNFIVSLINFFMYYFYSKKQFYELRFHRKINWMLFLSLLKFSGWNMFGSFSQIVRNQGVNILLNFFFGPVVNAARGIAFQIKSAVMGLIQNISTAARPQVVESYAKEDFLRSKTLMYGISKICFVLLYMVVMPLSLEIEYVLHLWLGDNIPQYTSVFSILVLLTSLIDILNLPISMIIMASGKIGKYNILTSIIGLFELPLSFLLLKLGYSPVCVFIVTFFMSFLIQVASIKILEEKTGILVIDYIKSIVFPLTIFSIISPILPYFVYNSVSSSFTRFSIVIFISIVVVLTVSCFCVLNRNEKKLVKNLISQIIKRR